MNDKKIDKFDNIYIVDLKKRYTFVDREKVTNFIFKYPFLVDILFEARPLVEEFFPESEVKLYVEDRYVNQLVARVYSKNNDMDEDERVIFKLDRKWFNKVLPRVRGKFIITA
jgi:hypothetical protein